MKKKDIYEILFFIIFTLYLTIDLINISNFNVLNYLICISISLYLLIISIKQYDIKSLLIFIGVSCIWLFYILLNSNNFQFFKFRGLRFFLYCVPVIIIIQKLKSYALLKKYTIKYSYILTLFGIIIFIDMFLKNKGVSYNGSLANIFSIATIFLIEKVINKVNLLDVIIIILNIIITLAVGQRSSLLIIIFYILVRIINAIIIKKNLFVLISSLTIIYIGMINVDKLFIMLSNILSTIGINSRTLNLFMNGNIMNHLSGREILYAELIEGIKLRPIIGYGICGDSLFLNSIGYNFYYSHSIILEMLSSFGIIIGSLIIITIIILVIYTILGNNSDYMIIRRIFMTISISTLLFNSSFWISLEFWVFIAMIFNNNKSFVREVNKE